MDDDIIQGTPICMEHDCTYVCSDGVELFCPLCKQEEKEKLKKEKKQNVSK